MENIEQLYLCHNLKFWWFSADFWHGLDLLLSPLVQGYLLHIEAWNARFYDSCLVRWGLIITFEYHVVQLVSRRKDWTKTNAQLVGGVI